MSEEEFQNQRRAADLARIIIKNRQLEAEASKAEEEARSRNSEPRWLLAIKKYKPGVVAAGGLLVPVLAGLWTYCVWRPLQDAGEKLRLAEGTRLQLLIDRAQYAESQRLNSVYEAGLAKKEKEEALKDKEHLSLQAKDARVALKDAQNATEAAKTSERQANTNAKQAMDDAEKAQIIIQEAVVAKLTAEKRLREVLEAEEQLRDQTERLYVKQSELEWTMLSDLEAERTLLKLNIVDDIDAKKSDLQAVQIKGGVVAQLARAVLNTSITKAFFLVSTNGFTQKYKNAKATIESQYDPTTGGKTVLKGPPLGLIDLTYLGTGRRSIVFTDEAVYFCVRTIYHTLTMDQFSKARINILWSNRATITSDSKENGLDEIGPIEFAHSRITAEEFVNFQQAFSNETAH